MGKRIITTVLGLPILFFVLNAGGVVLALSLLLITLIGLREFYSSIAKGGYLPVSWAGYAITVALYTLFIYGENIGTIMSLLPIILVLLLVVWVISYKTVRFEDLMITWFGFTYITLLFSTLLLIDRLNIQHAIWLVFVISWSCDSLAYLTGLSIGKHKLAPAISPKKTIEGALGGIVGSMLGCLVFAYYMMPEHMMPLTIVGFIGSIFSQTGDLTASLIKRKMAVKDFGYLFPGHGGVLDRFDSILFTAPVVYVFLLVWMMKG